MFVNQPVGPMYWHFTVSSLQDLDNGHNTQKPSQVLLYNKGNACFLVFSCVVASKIVTMNWNDCSEALLIYACLDLLVCCVISVKFYQHVTCHT